MQLVDNPALLVYHHHHHHPPLRPRPTSPNTAPIQSLHIPIFLLQWMCSLSHEYTMHSPYLNFCLHWYLDLAWGKHTTEVPKLQLKSHASFDIPAQIFFHESFSSSFSTKHGLCHLCASNGHTLFIPLLQKRILNISICVLHTKFLTSNKSVHTCCTTTENK